MVSRNLGFNISTGGAESAGFAAHGILGTAVAGTSLEFRRWQVIFSTTFSSDLGSRLFIYLENPSFGGDCGYVRVSKFRCKSTYINRSYISGLYFFFPIILPFIRDEC